MHHSAALGAARGSGGGPEVAAAGRAGLHTSMSGLQLHPALLRNETIRRTGVKLGMASGTKTQGNTISNGMFHYIHLGLYRLYIYIYIYKRTQLVFISYCISNNSTKMRQIRFTLCAISVSNFQRIKPILVLISG